MLGCSLFVDEEEPTAETASNLCDDGNPCTFDVLGLGGCVHNPVAYGTSCTLASFLRNGQHLQRLWDVLDAKRYLRR